MPTDKRHNKVPQDKMLYHTQGEYKKPFFFENDFRCVTRPYPSGVNTKQNKYLFLFTDLEF